MPPRDLDQLGLSMCVHHNLCDALSPRQAVLGWECPFPPTTDPTVHPTCCVYHCASPKRGCTTAPATPEQFSQVVICLSPPSLRSTPHASSRQQSPLCSAWAPGPGGLLDGRSGPPQEDPWPGCEEGGQGLQPSAVSSLGPPRPAGPALGAQRGGGAGECTLWVEAWLPLCHGSCQAHPHSWQPWDQGAYPQSGREAGLRT